MKKIILFFVAITAAWLSVAQNTQPGCYPFPRTISVTGSAVLEIVPDEIYVQVDLREYKKKGEDKTEIDKIKADFLASCKAVGIADSNISVASFDGYNMASIWKRKKRDPDLMASISYQLKFSSTKLIDELVDHLDDQATYNFRITRTSHSKIIEYRKQLKIMAVKAAKEKAAYLTDAINEQVGQAITIEEPEESVASDMRAGNTYNNTGLLDNFRFKQGNGQEMDNVDGSVDFRKIKLRFEVKVLYALK